jgi:hypothetical protein
MHDMAQWQGGLQFMNLVKKVTELDQLCHQTENQVLFKEILERLQLGCLSEQDETQLRVLTLDYDQHTWKEINDILDGMAPTIYVLDTGQRMHIMNKKYAAQ